MKKNLLLSTLFSSLLLNFAFSQERVNIQPYSDLINIQEYENSLPEYVLGALDVQPFLEEDVERTKNGEFERFAIARYVDLTLDNSGVWSHLPNGDRIWRLKITSEGALATILSFDDFHMPTGGRIHIYNENKTDVIGAFTEYNNHESGVFSCEQVLGESCIIEYFEPAQQAGLGRISISDIGHVYRHVYPEYIQETPQLRIDESDACQVDVNCSPENSGWSNQIKSEVRIRVKVQGSFGYCSGTVVNNTAQDCTPYVLTAWHCGEGATTAEYNSWIMVFNYQKANCGSGTASVANSMTGCAMKANSNDGGGNSGSDFLLVEMNNLIPTNYNPYFSGWDRSTYSSPVSNDGVGIHHPSGDCKKISTYTSNVTSSSWGSAAGSHWMLTWAATSNGHGVTEGGSSGSGIFRKDNGLLWGTLTGGGSCCTTNGCGSGTSSNSPDLYGKMSYHWTSNGSAANRQLKPWLDPTGSNVTTLTGTFYPCANSISEHELASLISLYPNPTEGRINLGIAEDNTEDLTIEVYNMLGEVVYSGKIVSGTINFSIDLSEQADGVYLVNLSTASTSISKKVILAK